LVRDLHRYLQALLTLRRRSEEALLRRDRDGWFAIHDEEFEIVPVRDWLEGAVRGREAGWEFHMRILESFEWVPVEVDHVDAGIDKVLGHLRADLCGAGSGAEVELDQWFVATVRQRRILRLQWFTDHADALEAAGLSE
jgi:ketosteroid isomerase-like protein